MPQIVKASAFANNEVAILGWTTDPPIIPGCLGFHIVREYLDAQSNVTGERALASYVAFRGQRNPSKLPQNTSIWPIQKFTWRDLTLRRRRDALARRPEDEVVRYRIRAVGRYAAGMEEVIPVEERHLDRATNQWLPNTYEGPRRKLGYLTAPAWTNALTVTRQRGPFVSTFTNGILSTQFLVRVLREDGAIQDGELKHHLETAGDPIRDYLAGDVLTTLEEFFAEPDGRFHAALYELEDVQLQGILEAKAARLDLILSDAGSSESEDAAGPGTDYDTRNAPARAALAALAAQPGTTFRMQNRMFNGSGHIGHNKFVVHVDGNGQPRSVVTGSTNWTWSGVAGQSNNLIWIKDGTIAAAFLAYWQRLKDDAIPDPAPLSAKNSSANQGAALKQANLVAAPADLGNGVTAECWFSPNVPGKEQPPGKSVKHPPPPPPDMGRLFELMRKAESMILFAVFLPSRGGLHSIIEKAVELGLSDGKLTVLGAISDPQAVWGYRPSGKTPSGKKLPAYAPHIFRSGNISIVRATALTDREIRRELGDFSKEETLTLGKAIIHDKILVIDPLLPDKCVVAFGSHNMGYKASYSNDENMVIVQGHAGLAQAYAAHVLDVYDHYRFRAAEAEKKAEGGANTDPWDGFLSPSSRWQNRANRNLAALFTS